MKRFIIFIILFSVLVLWGEGWKKSGDFSVLLSQSFYSDNWDGNEQGNINWTANLNFAMEKQLSKIIYDKNSLILSFGQTHTQEINENGEKEWNKPEISSDKIEYENLLTFTLEKYVDPYASFLWESKFYDKVSDDKKYYINPNMISLGAGLKKIIINKEKQNLEARLGIAYKNYFDQDPEKDHKSNAGGEFVFTYWYLMPSEMGKLDSNLRVYQALINSEDTEDDLWKTADWSWTTSFSFKFNSYIGLKLFYEILYDEEIVDAMRYQENLGINLSYTLF